MLQEPASSSATSPDKAERFSSSFAANSTSSDSANPRVKKLLKGAETRVLTAVKNIFINILTKPILGKGFFTAHSAMLGLKRCKAELRNCTFTKELELIGMIESIVPDLIYIILNSKDESLIGVASWMLTYPIAIGSSRSQVILEAIADRHTQRVCRNVLPCSKSSNGAVEAVVFDYFSGRYGWHGPAMKRLIEQQVGGRENIGIVHVNAFSSSREAQLEKSVKRLLDTGKNVVINVSFGSELDVHLVNGCLSPEVVERLGGEGVIIVIGAFNEGRIRGYLHPLFNNVLPIAAVLPEGDGFVLWRENGRGSSFGPDIFACGVGNGTSEAATAVTSAVAILLNHGYTPLGAIEELRRLALPIKGPLAKYLGVGVLPSPDLICSNSDSFISAKKDKRISSSSVSQLAQYDRLAQSSSLSSSLPSSSSTLQNEVSSKAGPTKNMLELVQELGEIVTENGLRAFFSKLIECTNKDTLLSEHFSRYYGVKHLLYRGKVFSVLKNMVYRYRFNRALKKISPLYRIIVSKWLTDRTTISERQPGVSERNLFCLKTGLNKANEQDRNFAYRFARVILNAINSKPTGIYKYIVKIFRAFKNKYLWIFVLLALSIFAGIFDYFVGYLGQQPRDFFRMPNPREGFPFKNIRDASDRREVDQARKMELMKLAKRVIANNIDNSDRISNLIDWAINEITRANGEQNFSPSRFFNDVVAEYKLDTYDENGENVICQDHFFLDELGNRLSREDMIERSEFILILLGERSLPALRQALEHTTDAAAKNKIRFLIKIIENRIKEIEAKELFLWRFVMALSPRLNTDMSPAILSIQPVFPPDDFDFEADLHGAYRKISDLLDLLNKKESISKQYGQAIASIMTLKDQHFPIIFELIKDNRHESLLQIIRHRSLNLLSSVDLGDGTKDERECLEKAKKFFRLSLEKLLLRIMATTARISYLRLLP